MSDSSLELVRRGFVPWREGRMDEFAPLLAPDIEWDLTGHPLPDFPSVGSGREAFLRHFADYAAGWRNYEISEVESFAVGDDVVFVACERVTMRDTDIAIDRTLAVVWSVRDGLLARFRVYRTREDALAALDAASA